MYLIAQAHGAPAADAHTDPHAADPHLAQTHTTTGTPNAHAEGGSHGDEHGGHASPREFFAFSLAAFVVIAVLAIIGMRRLQLVPRGLQNFLEFVLESLYGIPEMVMGPRGRQYAPFVVTFFLYIAVMNFTGLIPGAKPGTASLSITLGLSIVAFVAVQYFGFRAHGIRYLAHFAGPVPWLAFLILPLELVAEMIRPISLSIRLYGNIFGEETVVAALANLHPLAALIILPLQVLTVFLQAFVFTLLVTVYISLATEPHEGEHAEHAPVPAP
jgi:F-type H+-transporting ATPase subunit a